MNHSASSDFWHFYGQLPVLVQRLADKNYALLKANPLHPSLHFKKVGLRRNSWSIRVGKSYRALGKIRNGDVVWIWIGTHAEYNELLTHLD